MGHSRLSVTIPDELYGEFKMLASRKNMKLSHLVADAIKEKAQKLKAESFIHKVNKAFEDPEIRDEQRRMAETAAANINLDELPW